MTFVNLTPHKIVVFTDSGNLVIEPSGMVARSVPSQTVVGIVNGISVVKTVFGEVEGLPSPKRGVVYIVSTLVLQALKDRGIVRNDVVAPDTSPQSVVRDDAGNIVGVRRFQVL